MEFLVPYSDSENSDSEEEKGSEITETLNPPKRLKLPCAKDKLGALGLKFEEDAASAINADQHQNRIRSFKHERGNWATFVYISVDGQLLDEIPEFCQNELANFVDLHVCKDFHITLSKTVVLQYHLIDNFVETLKISLNTSSFAVFISQLEVYVNEEKTRTFIGFKVESSLKLINLLKRVDAVLLDFKLPAFHEEPSFHISFAWCLGNEVNFIKSKLKRLTAAIQRHYPESLSTSLAVKDVRCKIGHKIYTFILS